MEDGNDPNLAASPLAEMPPIEKLRENNRLRTLDRIGAGLAAFAGLCSFAVQGIRTAPAVLGRAMWSPLDILSQLYMGTLPVNMAHGIPWVIVSYFAILYIVLIFTLALVSSLTYKRLRALASVLICTLVVGSFCIGGVGTHRNEPAAFLKWMFYGSEFSGHINCNLHFAILWVVVLSLTFIGASPYWQDPERTPRDFFPDRGN